MFVRLQDYFLAEGNFEGGAERVELTCPVEEAKQQARTEEPADGPIYRESEPIPEEEMAAAGIPEPERPEVGVEHEHAPRYAAKRAGDEAAGRVA